MTGAQFSEVDLDRLADYTAGTLEPADAQDVEALIDGQPEWAQTHRALVAADTLIANQLRAVADAEPIGSMPAHLAERVQTALANSGRTPVISLADVRQRRSRWRPVLVAAAAVVGIALCGGPLLTVVLQTSQADSGTSAADRPAMSSDGDAQENGSGGDLTSLPGGPVLIASGLDYGPQSLDRAALQDTAAASTFKVPQADSAAPGAPAGRVLPPSGAPDELSRLGDVVALRACLDEISKIVPGRASTVDFARYDGSAALVVLIQPDSSPSPAVGPHSDTVVVVGPGCGGSLGADLVTSRLL